MSGVRPHHRIANGASRSIGSRFFAGFLRADAEGVRFFSFWRCFTIANVNYEINEEILDKELRIISDTGEQLGIMSAEEALKIAEERELDLVKISPAAKPPVCKIMDYGKFRFEQAKREKEAKKNQRVMEVKEVRMSPNIDANDFNTKLKNAQKFLNDGDRVKVSIRFRGREMAHMNLGADTMKRFAAFLADCSVVEKQPLVDGRKMIMILAAKPAAKTSGKSAKQAPKAEKTEEEQQ